MSFTFVWEQISGPNTSVQTNTYTNRNLFLEPGELTIGEIYEFSVWHWHINP